MPADLTNHLWQSTLFVLAAAGVAVALRQNGAHVRHAIWVVASVKFLVPFAWLMALGAFLPAWTPTPVSLAPSVPAQDYSRVVERIAEPFDDDLFVSTAPISAEAPPMDWTMAVVVVWAIGFAAVVGMRVRGWWRVRAAIRASAAMPLASPYPVRSTPGLLEPGVVGFWRPVLLMPAGIESRLTPAQLRAVLEHEFAHVRRRDNLTAAMHMAVEAMFWFHPVVWWVGARMVEERERACDEHVLRVCGEPQTYAESILNVCKLYVESPIACVSGVTGADLKRRITAIMGNDVGRELTMVRRTVLALAAAMAVVTPLVAGAITAPPQARSSAAFEVASVKPCDPNAPAPQQTAPAGGRRGGAPWAAMISPGYVYWHCATLAQLIPQAYADAEQPLLNVVMQLRSEDGNQPRYVKGGPSWVTADTFTIEGRASVDVTAPALDGRTDRTLSALPPGLSQALRSVLEERFQLKVRRVTEERDVYAMTLGKGGLDPKRITVPAPGDCQTSAEYFASPLATAPLADKVKALDAGLPKICGGTLSMSQGRFQYTSATLGTLARDMSRRTDFVVVDQTGLSGPYNFTLTEVNYMGATEDVWIRAVEQLGLKFTRIKAPAEHLVIESVQRLRPDEPAFAEASAGKPADALAEGDVTAPPQTPTSATRFEVVSIKPCPGQRAQTPPSARPGGGRGGAAAWAPQVSPGHVYIDCIALTDLIDLAYSSEDRPLLNTIFQRPPENSLSRPSFQPKRVRGGPSWVASDRLTVEATGSVALTAAALAGRESRVLGSLPAAVGQALRAALEERFQLKVRRATEQQDMFALRVAKGGLKPAQIKATGPGDCLTPDEYFAADPTTRGNRICGRYFVTSASQEFYGFEMAAFARVLSERTDLHVLDETTLKGPYSFVLQYQPAAGTDGDRTLAALDGLGLTVVKTKAPAEYIVIESIQRLRPNEPA